MLAPSDIEAINIALLLSAAESARKHSASHGVHRFSVSEEQALVLASLTEEKAKQIAACGRSLFKPMPRGGAVAEKRSADGLCGLNEKISSSCYDLLVLIRECARTAPMEAVWKFNITMDTVKIMADTPLSDLREWSKDHVLRLCVLPHKTPENVPVAIHAMLCKSNPGE
jgi:hypothetical protein